MSLAQLQEQAAYEHSLASRYTELRALSAAMVANLSPEDCNLQPMPDTSPAKWHLAHTTWFFETFLLEPFAVGYLPADSRYSLLFNSYYNGVGEQFPRAQRGLLSRPTLAEVLAYRETVDAAVLELLGEVDSQTEQTKLIVERVKLGLHHEAQHQELLLTDIKYSLFQNPLLPAYRSPEEDASDSSKTVEPVPLIFVDCDGGEVSVGHDSDESFCFDNELPRHKVLVQPFRIANRLVTNAEYVEFVEDGGYQDPQHWLSDGWAEVQKNSQQQGWTQPLYWGRIDGQWFEYTLNGLQPLNSVAPVAHVSYFEAQAYAAWAGLRLPTEAEWESVAAAQPVAGSFVDDQHLHPQAADIANGYVLQLYGDCWEWTNSAYLPYPGYQAPTGAVGEYNGKFMSGQMVLRGGSCMSRAFHIRASYRNFFYPRDRWQCTGIRLAADL